jgi:hypothetical protein
MADEGDKQPPSADKPGAQGDAGSSDGGNGRSDDGSRGDGTTSGAGALGTNAPGDLPRVSDIRLDLGLDGMPSPNSTGPASICPRLGTDSSGTYCSNLRDPNEAVQLIFGKELGWAAKVIGEAVFGPVAGIVLGLLDGPSTAGPKYDDPRSVAERPAAPTPAQKSVSDRPLPGTRLY